VGLDGFEPSTPALSRRCSNQLSYRPAWVNLKNNGRHEAPPLDESKLLLKETADRGWALESAILERR
jgi:hypothetical protein